MRFPVVYKKAFISLLDFISRKSNQREFVFFQPIYCVRRFEPETRASAVKKKKKKGNVVHNKICRKKGKSKLALVGIILTDPGSNSGGVAPRFLIFV